MANFRCPRCQHELSDDVLATREQYDAMTDEEWLHAPLTAEEQAAIDAVDGADADLVPWP